MFVWNFIQEKVEKLQTFYVDFHVRKILVHFKKPIFIGDGKCILNCLSIPAAFCYICSISEEEGQNIDLVITGMPLDCSISKLRNHCKKLKAIFDKSGTKNTFNEYFSHTSKNLLEKLMFLLLFTNKYSQVKFSAERAFWA